MQQGASPTPNAPTLSAEERAAGWRPLFDGSTLAGWHNYHATGAPTGWTAANGVVSRVGRGGDLVTDEQFGNFDLALDWKVQPGGNSGSNKGVSRCKPSVTVPAATSRSWVRKSSNSRWVGRPNAYLSNNTVTHTDNCSHT